MSGRRLGQRDRYGWLDEWLAGSSLAATVALLAVTVVATPLGAELRFRSVGLAAGLTAERRPLQHAVADMSGGAAVGDFNRDGWQDLFVLGGGGAADALYLNNRDGSFTDYAAAAGVAYQHRGLAAAVGDYDGDGWLDLYVTSLGAAAEPRRPGAHRLYRNLGPSPPTDAPTATLLPIPRFAETAAMAGVATSSRSRADGMGAAFGDYDLDGDLDLFVSGYQYHDGNRLFRNDGGSFTDVTEAVLAHAMEDGELNLWGFAPAFVDMDGDRLPELLVAGDYGTSRYFRNDGGGGLTDITADTGTGVGAMGMGSAIADFNGDGLFDWYLTSVYSKTGHEVQRNGNQLYLAAANHKYREVSVAAGVNHGGWGWGAVAVDLNHDGAQDLVATNGWPRPNHQEELEWLSEPTRVYLARASTEPRFDFVQDAVGLLHRDQGRGVVNFDYDNDGDQDILIVNLTGRPSLFRNDLTGSDTNWLRVFLERGASRSVAPDGFGARVSVRTGDRWQHRLIHGGSTYLSVAELSAHFGLRDVRVADELRVTWPDGAVATLTDVPANQTLTITHTASSP